MLEISPAWDPTDRVTIRLDPGRRELEVRADPETLRYRLRDSRPERLGWVEEHATDNAAPVRRRVPLSEVVLACLREWDAEEAVIALSRHAAQDARRRGPAWQSAARKLSNQAAQARGRKRVSALPLQVLWRHRSDPARPAPLTSCLAAQRAGYRTQDGREDTQRFRRRLGVAHSVSNGQRSVQRAVSYETGLALCEALDITPTDIGL